MRARGLPLLLLTWVSGCGVDPVTTVALSLGSNLAANSLFGESKMTRDAREAYVRAPPCSSMTRGIPNGRIVTRVREVGWFQYYQFPDGRQFTPSSGNGLVVVDYEIANRGDEDVLVTPRRLVVGDSQGKIAREKAGAGGPPSDPAAPDDEALLRGGNVWGMISVFEAPPGEYALLVPNGRLTEDSDPHWLDGCRFPGPSAARRS
jgi:hypothetical protein